MKKLLAVASLVLAMALSSFAALTPYTSPKGDFTVDTPATFKVDSQSVTTPSGDKYTATNYTAKESNGNVLMIGTSVFPYAVTQEQLDKAAAEAIEDVHGVVRDTQPYNGGTFYIVSVSSGQILLITRALGNEAYILMFYAPKANIEAASEEVGDIASSFTTKAKK